MSKRKWIITTSAFLLVLLLMAGYMAVASEYGSQDDPMVTLSYITDVLAPDTIAKVNEVIEVKSQEFTTAMNQKLTEYTSQLDATIADFEERNDNLATDSQFIDAVTNSVLARLNGQTTTGSGGSSTTGGAVSSGWTLLTLEKGKTLTFSVGGMVLVRVGSASCYAPSSPGLIDLTDGSELAANKNLAKNHLYMITVDGRGFKATASSKILVYGSYTVG